MNRTPIGKKKNRKETILIPSGDTPLSKKSRTAPHIVVVEDENREYIDVDSQEGDSCCEERGNAARKLFSADDIASIVDIPLEDHRIKIEGESAMGDIESNKPPSIERIGEEEHKVELIHNSQESQFLASQNASPIPPSKSQENESTPATDSIDVDEIPHLEPLKASPSWAAHPSEQGDESIIFRRLVEGSTVLWKGQHQTLRSWKSSKIERLSIEDPPLDDYQQVLLDEIVPNRGVGSNVWITGAAGTGKSVLLRAIIKKLKKRNVTFAVAAPTGIAAFQVGGQTLHSWFGYQGDGKTVKQSAFAISVLIIDEISMMDAEMLEFLSDFGKKCGNGGPFGGIQVIVCGDFLQLPPVDKTSDNCKYAFETQAWKECNFRVVELKKVHRQADAELIEVLSDVRQGSISSQTEAILKSRCGIDHGEEVIKLRAYAKQVDEINKSCFEKLPAPTCYYTVVDSGDAKELNELRVPARLELRVGARVMLLFNLSIDNGLVNGACGTVVGFHECNSLTSFNLPQTYDNLRKLAGPIAAEDVVYCPLVLFDGWGSVPQRLVQIEPKLFRTDGVTTHSSSESDSGSVRLQLPLVLAYAITIHKSQGLTLARYNVDIKENFASGQCYVALSRASSIDSLSIEPFDSPLQVEVSDKARRFQNSISESMRESHPSYNETKEELMTHHRPQCHRCSSKRETDGAPFWQCSTCLANYGIKSFTWDQSAKCRRCEQDATHHCSSCGRSVCNQCLASNASKCCRDCA